MATPVIMPKFGMTQESGTIVRWLHQEGERVEKDDPLLEVETDKVTMEVEAPASGILVRISAREGETVPVTTVIALVAQPAEALAASPAGETPPPPHPAVTAQRANATQHADVRATPVAQRVAAAAGIDIRQVPATTPEGTIRREDVEQYLAQNALATAKPRATPAARRLAREHRVDLSQVNGSGPRGRIQASDVPLTTSVEPAHQTAQPTTAGMVGPDTVEPLTSIRRTIAARLTQSYQTMPHITLSVDVDMSATEKLRAELNRQADALKAPRVSVTAMLVKTCAWALHRHRWLNASWQNNDVRFHADANIGVAVALDEGIIVPVLHAADQLGLGDIAAHLHDLTSRARQGRLTLDEVRGGTFTISNLGMFGIQHFTAIINPPEGAILAVGAMAKRLVVIEADGEDQAVIRPIMNLTLSVDHRLIDGATAARFLQDVARVMEQPSLLMW